MAVVGSIVGRYTGRRGPVSAALGKTYADFQAHIATLATDGSVAYNAVISASGLYRSTMVANVGDMTGSPWSSIGGYNGFADAVVNRMLRHALPTQAAMDAQVSAGREIYFRVNEVGLPGETIPGADRNGYISFSGTGVGPLFVCLEVIFWDGTQAQRMNPSTSTGPTPYSF